MSFKDLEGKFRKKIISLIIMIIGVSLMVVTPLFFMNRDKNATKPTVEPVYTVDSTENLIQMFYEGQLSATQMQREVNKYLKHEPNFATDLDNDISDEPAKAITRTNEMRDLLTAYLDGLFVQQEKLDKVTQLVSNELTSLQGIYEDPIRDTVFPTNGYEAPLLNGLISEMQETPLYLNSTDEDFTVWVDYDVLGREYHKYFTDFHKNLMILHKDIMRFGYTREDGEIDVRHIFNRLELIDEIQDGNLNKDNFYWEKERYQHAILLTGYGTKDSPNWDNKRLEQMKVITSVIDDDYNLDHEPYLRIVHDLLMSYENEGEYGEETIRIANKWMHDEFMEYREYLEENQSKK